MQSLKFKCLNCTKIGHFAKVCQQKSVKVIDEKTSEESESENDTYQLNLWKIKVSQNVPKFNVATKHDFTKHLFINNRVVKILIDTGAKVSVCGMKQAKSWGILDKLKPLSAKAHPYNSTPIKVRGTALCSVTYNDRTVPVEFYVLPGSCQPILEGTKVMHLKIISMDNEDELVFNPVKMIDTDESKGEFTFDIASIIQQYPENFKGLGKLNNYQVKLYFDENVKPVAVPPRTIPYHLQTRVADSIDNMIKDGVIEEHPSNEPAPWVSCAVVVPKPDGSLRITLDARNVNKALVSTNYPIPKQDDIKAKLSGSKIFSKLDFKSAFWQLELDPESRHLTVFHANNKLYRYTRLIMGTKPAQSELSAALRPIFGHIPNVFLIHDDLVIATKTTHEHKETLSKVMDAVRKANLTLNKKKCIFGKSEIKFWGMLFTSEGVKPDPEKVKVLENISPPKDKDELKSFICMMQSNSDFIPNFSKKVALLRTLLNEKIFCWTHLHQKTFDNILNDFKENILLSYFDMELPTYIFTDAHVTGLGAILYQGKTFENLKPVAIASRCTNKAEKNYAQIDLEAMAIDFALRRFRSYLVGSPNKTVIITDHSPLISIFNGKRSGSIRTERIKLRHQDIRFIADYQKGQNNPADYLSRHAMNWDLLNNFEKKESGDLTNLLYTLHVTPVIDAIGIKEIAEHTTKDPVLYELRELIKSGKNYIPKNKPFLNPYREILSEITYVANGTLLKQDKIILPETLYEKAIKLAHSGAHPEQNGLIRRLRSHFFIKNLEKKASEFLNNCFHCQMFTNKVYRHPLEPNKVPGKCWEETSVDLFGPLPSQNHIIVIQDLASRYPVAKLVKSTSAKFVIPVLEEIYDTFGNPTRQKSDNGPPFNSKEMKAFTDNRNIEQIKTPPGHPSPNNSETVMKPLGKAMKIGHSQNQIETKTLSSFLVNYRDTPHSATGVAPAHMMFRDGYRSNLPHKSLSEEQIKTARQKDSDKKYERKNTYLV